MMEKKFEELDVKELKALAYDEFVKLETAQSNIRIINARIAELSKPKTEE